MDAGASYSWSQGSLGTSLWSCDGWIRNGCYVVRSFQEYNGVEDALIPMYYVSLLLSYRYSAVHVRAIVASGSLTLEVGWSRKFSINTTVVQYNYPVA